MADVGSGDAGREPSPDSSSSSGATSSGGSALNRVIVSNIYVFIHAKLHNNIAMKTINR